MKRLTIVLLVVGLAVVGLGLWLAPNFLPEGQTTVDRLAAPTSGTGSSSGPMAVVVKSGTFQGADSFHYVEGTSQIVVVDGVHHLRFLDYRQRAGPDVFVYLVPSGHSGTPESVGLKVLVPGGADGGESTLEGNFDVALPAGFDPSAYGGVVVWCDQYDTRFGSAELKAV